MPRLDFSTREDVSVALEILGEYFCECSSCNELTHNDNSSYIDDDNYCADCAESANYCSSCNETTFADMTNVDGDDYCDSCLHNECYCDEDGEWHYGEAPEEEEEEEEEDGPITIGMARYHSDPIRARWRVPSEDCIGIEIETYCETRDDMSNALRNGFNCACERDGSLDSLHGIEVITPPTPIAAFMPMLENVARIMSEHGCSSWRKRDCQYGVHVNLDCRHWSTDRRAKFCGCFGPTNKTWLTKYAARETSYAVFNDSDIPQTVESKFSAAGIKSGGRMEIRIFKSSRRIETLTSYVSLCHDIARFTLCDDFSSENLYAWILENGSIETLYHMAKRKITD